jgi:metal-sulfur cluster biosynthetic enzyme
MINKSEVITALRRVIDPELHRSIVELGMVMASSNLRWP